MLAAKALAVAAVPPVRTGWPLPWDDVAVAAGLAAVVGFLPRALRVAIVLVVVAATTLSLLLVRTVGVPLLPSLLRGFDPAMGDSVAAYLTMGSAAAAGLIGAAAVFGGWLGRRWSLPPAALAAIAATAGGIALIAEAPDLAHRNAVAAFARAVLPRAVPTPAGAPIGERRVAGGPLLPSGAAAGRNVVFVVLESAAQRFVAANDSPSAMPFLRTLAAQGLDCTDASATYPESIEGQVAVFCGLPPMPDASPRDYARHAAQALPHRLRPHGYRSALFHSGRFDFLGMRDVIGPMGFDVLADAATLGGERSTSFGIDEETTVDALLRWLGELPPAQRAFACWLPIAGHHPYSSPPGGPFPTDTQLGCYRNALHYADRMLARLWAGMCALAPSEQWLLVVVGDHGQAFGEQPGNFGHAFAVYDENLRVPFVVCAPGAIAPGLVHDAPCSHLDVAPTLLDLLGVGGEGALRADPGAERCVHAFTDWGDLQVAARTQRWQLVHDLASGRDQLLDRSGAGGGGHDVAAAQPDVVVRLRAEAVRWLAAARAGPQP